MLIRNGRVLSIQLRSAESFKAKKKKLRNENKKIYLAILYEKSQTDTWEETSNL